MLSTMSLTKILFKRTGMHDNITWQEVMERQIADQNKHLYEAYAKIVELQEENKELKEQLAEAKYAELVLE